MQLSRDIELHIDNKLYTAPPCGGCRKMEVNSMRAGTLSLFPITIVLFAQFVAALSSVDQTAAASQEWKALRPERSVVGQVLTSSAAPAICIQVDSALPYIGGQRFILHDTVDAEQHFFLEVDKAKAIFRMYWIQFERFLPGRPGEYSYEYDKTVTFSGLKLLANVRRFIEPPAPDSDRKHAYEFLEKLGYPLPAPATRVRLVYLFEESRRQEVMIIYLEPAEIIGEVTAEESAAIIQRAMQGITIGR